MLELHADFAAIHGYLCGDGYVIMNPKAQKHKYYVIGFRNQNQTLLRDFQKRFRKVFGASPRMRKDGRCVVNSKKLFYEISKYGSFYSDSWKLPKDSSKDMRFWLRGFFDCEAWVELDKRKNRRIGLDSINGKELLKIRDLLSSFGIESRIRENKNRKTSRLQIFGKKNLIMFEKEIGFLHPEKRKGLKEAIYSYPKYEWEFPEKQKELRKFIRNIVKKKAKIKLCKSELVYIRFFSIIEDNLQKMSKGLYDLYGIKSKTYRSVNGNGRVYYELSIQDINSVKKMLENNLLSKSMRESLALQNPYRG